MAYFRRKKKRNRNLVCDIFFNFEKIFFEVMGIFLNRLRFFLSPRCICAQSVVKSGGASLGLAVRYFAL